MEDGWRRMSDAVIVPEVHTVQWDGFASATMLIEAGEKAAEKALPDILKWIEVEKLVATPVNGKQVLTNPADIIREIAR
jgi:hypothetical protein